MAASGHEEPFQARTLECPSWVGLSRSAEVGRLSQTGGKPPLSDWNWGPRAPLLRSVVAVNSLQDVATPGSA